MQEELCRLTGHIQGLSRIGKQYNLLYKSFLHVLHSFALFSTFDFRKLMLNKCFLRQSSEIDLFSLPPEEEWRSWLCSWLRVVLLEAMCLSAITVTVLSYCLLPPHSFGPRINNGCKVFWHTSASCNSVSATTLVSVGFKCNLSLCLICPV